MSSSSAPLNPDSLAGPDCPIDSKTDEFSVSLGLGAGDVVETVMVVEPSLFCVTVVVEYYSLLALVRSPLIVFDPDLVCVSEAAAEATASLETVVTVSLFVVVSAGTLAAGTVGVVYAGVVDSVDVGAAGSVDAGA